MVRRPDALRTRFRRYNVRRRRTCWGRRYSPELGSGSSSVRRGFLGSYSPERNARSRLRLVWRPKWQSRRVPIAFSLSARWRGLDGKPMARNLVGPRPPLRRRTPHRRSPGRHRGTKTIAVGRVPYPVLLLRQRSTRLNALSRQFILAPQQTSPRAVAVLRSCLACAHSERTSDSDSPFQRGCVTKRLGPSWAAGHGPTMKAPLQTS
jgi:hypothetical protein